VSPGTPATSPETVIHAGGAYEMAPKTSPETLLVATVSEEHKDRGVPGAHLRHPRRPSSTRARTKWPQRHPPRHTGSYCL